jgi:hypothetical protein
VYTDANIVMGAESADFFFDCSYLKVNTDDGISYVKETPWPESASELYRPSDRRLSAKLVPTFADIGCHVVSA